MIQRQRSLRFSALAVAGPVLLAFLALFFIVAQISLSRILTQAEDAYLGQQRALVEGLWADAAASAYAIADDVAVWDETAGFVLGENPGYIGKNWPEVSILEAYGFHFVVFKDAGGNDVYTEFYDPVEKKPETGPAGFSDALSALCKTLADRYAGGPVAYDTIAQLGLGGVFFHEGQAYFAAAMPVVDSRGTGPVYGTVVFGLRLDHAYLAHLTHLSDVAFSVQDTDPGADQAHMQRSGRQTALTVIPLADWHGRPASLILGHDRGIYVQGLRQAGRAALFLLFPMAVLILVLYHIANSRVLRPFEQLSRDISTQDIAAGIDPGKYSKSREFVTLCSAIDGLMMAMRQSSISINAFENILNGIDAYIYVSDPETSEVLFVNDKLRDGFGRREDLVGRPCWQVLQSGFSGPCPFCPVPQLLENPGRVISWEEQNTRTGRLYENADRLIPWIDGRLVHLQLGIDVTQMRQAQNDLNRRLEQQALMSAIAQSFISTEDMGVLIDNALEMTGRFLGADKVIIAALTPQGQGLEYRYGWSDQALGAPPVRPASMPFVPGNTFYDILVTEGHAFAACADTEADPRFAFLRPFGVRSVLSVPIFVDGRLWGCANVDTVGRPHVWTESDVNLTGLIVSVIAGAISRNAMERQLIEAKEQAEEMSRAKSNFLSRMSHEMRTPMNAIIGMTGIAQGTDELERKDYCLERVGSASRHLLGVINDILDMSKIESGKFELHEAEFDFEHMLMKVVSVIGFRADERQQTLTFSIAPDMPRYLLGDEQRLSQVITNLLSNACKFTPNQGAVTVEAGCQDMPGGGLELRVSVRDTGIGISAEQQSRLFQSFEQADGGISRRFGGTGLGLAICKSIVELMDGRIWVESALGEGATFTFTAKVGRGKRAPKGILPQGVGWENLRVLVVDDAPEVREYFMNIARSLKLCCETADGGEQACAMIDSRRDAPYNIIFVDWRMPGMDGIALTRKIKERCGEQTVVIMISSADWSVIEEDAQQAGVDKYLAKPLFPSVIADCINQCLGEAAHPALSQAELDESMDGRFAGRRVMLAEDIEINREIVLALLEPTGVEIVCAENGRQALALYEAEPEAFDLIFMDIHMPEMDGYEATRRIRALGHARAKKVPIIAMTANVFKEDVDSGIAAGMNAHVGKPLDIAEVFAVMRQFL